MMKSMIHQDGVTSQMGDHWLTQYNQTRGGSTTSTPYRFYLSTLAASYM